jgi:hypothetical protein
MLSEDRIRNNYSEALEQLLEHSIVQRTWGRLHQLRVEVTEDRVVVHGYTAWYYVKQLAIQAVLEALGPTQGRRVQVDIEVNTSHPRVTAGVAGCCAQS